MIIYATGCPRRLAVRLLSEGNWENLLKKHPKPMERIHASLLEVKL